MINEQEIRRFWDIEKRGNRLTEIRLISPEGKIGSGYFRDIETILTELRKYPNYGVYYTINTPLDEVYDRIQKDKICFKVKSTTQDKEIKGRNEVVIDLDPVRASGINSTEEELGYAKQKANEIYRWLLSQGFYPPLCNISANGCHLKLRCAMKNTDENTEIVKKFLGVVDMLFSDEKVDCDTSLYNASRILKVCGTISNKGNDDPNSDRPRRMAYYTKVPDDWFEDVNPNEYFEKVAAMYPEPEQPNRSNNYNPRSFNIEDFIKEHNIEVLRTVETSKMTKFLLKSCPWGGEAHGGGSAALFLMPNGSCGFKCQHSSCSHHNIKDFRLFYAPDSFTKRDYLEYAQRQRYYGKFEREPFVPKPETEDLGKKWLALGEIERVNIAELSSTNTGYPALDKAMWGLFMGDVTIITGESGQGKSVWLNNVCANMIERNVKLGIWSGELPAWKIADWMHCTLSGKTYNKKKIGYDDWFYAPKAICDKIDEWTARRLVIYNNKYGNNFAQLFADIKEAIDKDGLQVVVVDNLAALNLSEYQGSELEKQKNFITDIKNLALSKNIHCLIVAHTKKTGQDLGRKESVSGNKNITDLADNVIIVSRQGIDFRKKLVGFLGEAKAQEYDNCDTILEICKSRMSGTQDKFIGLYYEVESRRIKNSRAEHIVYGWEEQPAAQPLFAVNPEPTQMYDPFSDPDFLTPTDEECPF